MTPEHRLERAIQLYDTLAATDAKYQRLKWCLEQADARLKMTDRHVVAMDDLRKSQREETDEAKDHDQVETIRRDCETAGVDHEALIATVCQQTGVEPDLVRLALKKRLAKSKGVVA